MAIDIASLMTMKISIVNNPSIDKWLLYHMLADLTSLNITIAQDAKRIHADVKKSRCCCSIERTEIYQLFLFLETFLCSKVVSLKWGKRRNFVIRPTFRVMRKS